MKNKKVTTFLIVVVIAIWGIVFYRLVSSFSGNDDYAITSGKKAVISSESFEEQKPYKLLVNYRDPFLGKTFSEKPENVVRRDVKPVVKVEVPPAPEIDWSFIKFLGAINNSGKKIAIVSINDQEFMLKEGEVIKEVKCVKNYKDSITVSYQGKLKNLKR